VSSAEDVRASLRAATGWRGDRTDASFRADITGWWRDADLLSALGPELADLVSQFEPTVVLGLQSRGVMFGRDKRLTCENKPVHR
jgi:adenine phosphoribosyltransferase